MRTPLTEPQRWCLGIFSVFFLVTMMQVRCAPTRPPSKPAVVVPVLREEDALTDTGPDAGGVPLGPPPAPLPWQKTQPCAAWEHAINGACYIRMEEEAMKPPCAPGFVEHKRRCYKAIAKATQQPVSDPP